MVGPKEIREKINKSGIDSLTKKELDQLFKAAFHGLAGNHHGHYCSFLCNYKLIKESERKANIAFILSSLVGLCTVVSTFWQIYKP